MVETLSSSMHEFLGTNLLSLSEEMSFEVFFPYGAILTKTEKNRKNSKPLNCEKPKKKMV